MSLSKQSNINSPNATTWRDIDLTFGDYKVLSQLQNVSKSLEEVAKLVQLPNVVMPDVRKRIKEIRTVDNTLLTRTNEIFDTKKTITSERNEILRDILNARKDVSTRTSEEAVKCSAPIAVSQFVNLWDAWQELKDNNMILAESKPKMTQIELDVERIRKFCEEIKNPINRYRLEKDEKVRKQILKQVRELTKQISTGYAAVRAKMDDLKFSYEGKLLNLKFSKFALSDSFIMDSLRVNQGFTELASGSIKTSIANISTYSVAALGDFYFAKKADNAIGHLFLLVRKLGELDGMMREIASVRDDAEKFLLKNGEKIDW